MNITINGSNNTIIDFSGITLRELRAMLPSTKGVDTPSRNWVRDNLVGEQVFFSKAFPDGSSLVVFKNGFYRYGDENWTVLRVDGFSRLYYEVDDAGSFEHLDEEEFIDSGFIYALGENAMWQLKKNAEKRRADHGEVSIDNETADLNTDQNSNDVLESIIEREEQTEEACRLRKAWNTLTSQQKEVIWLIKVKKLTQEEVATKLNISRPRVTKVLKQTIEKLQKNI